MRAVTAAVTPTMITTICLTSAQVTACTPPSIVYRVVGIPMARLVSGRLHPSTMERMTAGAAMTTPAPRPRESRNSRLVSARVRASKRRSRYS